VSVVNYVTRVLSSPLEVNAAQWNALLYQSPAPTPFMRHEYLAALHASGSAVPDTGWTPKFITLWQGDELQAACPMYLKAHSYGEYVFDWAWASAYQQHGLRYYPKAVVAVPFTPVPGSRYISKNGSLPAVLLREQLSFCDQHKISSLHVLFGAEADVASCETSGLMPRQTVQFHWTNVAPTLCADASPPPSEGSGETRRYRSFDDFLNSLTQDKRKKIRAERRKVSEAGVRWRVSVGAQISAAEWDFFYRCYNRTYREHGNPPYLTPAFFEAMADTMPENWVMFTAQLSGTDIATSLIAVSASNTPATSQSGSKNVAYGRYWGALQRVDSLHFDACYYQPLQWCIENGFDSFEGGAQGEHKMARGLLPVVTPSAHWLAHPQFADAVARFLEREGQGVSGYVEHLEGRNPFRG
jgi:uncharacterized protein